MDNINTYLLYNFNNQSILEIALTHPSLSKSKNEYLTYEKLEFLGDAVLNLVITDFLISQYRTENEGFLAKRKAVLISGKILVKIAKMMKLENFIKLSLGEELSGGRVNQNNLENCLEAIIGAMYLDGGLEVCKSFIYKYWVPIAKAISEPPNDPKTELQEWSQKLSKPIPVYELVNIEGPAHQPEFTVSLIIDGLEEVQTKGPSKKIAQKEAAKIMLDKIKQKNE